MVIGKLCWFGSFKNPQSKWVSILKGFPPSDDSVTSHVIVVYGDVALHFYHCSTFMLALHVTSVKIRMSVIIAFAVFLVKAHLYVGLISAKLWALCCVPQQIHSPRFLCGVVEKRRELALSSSLFLLFYFTPQPELAERLNHIPEAQMKRSLHTVCLLRRVFEVQAQDVFISAPEKRSKAGEL